MIINNNNNDDNNNNNHNKIVLTTIMMVMTIVKVLIISILITAIIIIIHIINVNEALASFYSQLFSLSILSCTTHGSLPVSLSLCLSLYLLLPSLS